MIAWLNSLSPLEYMTLLVAVPATLVMVLQTLLLLFGLLHEGDTGFDHDGDLDHDTGFDHDFDHDGDLDQSGPCDLPHDFQHDTAAGHDYDANSAVHDGGGGEGLFSGLKIFTIRGIVAFLSIFGWGGLWLLRIGLTPFLALFLAVAMGVWAMVLVALALKAALGLQSDGTVEAENALGLPGTVYLHVPPGRTGEGKVNVLVQERLTEFVAVTDDPEQLPTGSEITVVAVTGKNVLVVTRK